MASVGALSVRLHRDETRVSRDLAVLADMGLVALERTGKSKRIRAEPKPILLV